MSDNVYHTTDPEVLLRLKRQEADAIRDVIRSFNNARNAPEQIFKIAQNTLLAQLGVRKMKFIYLMDKELKTGVNFGFRNLGKVAISELPQSLEVMKVEADIHPKLFEMGAEYVIPVKFQNEIASWFLVSNFYATEAERENDLIFIETIANILSAALENRLLMEDMVRQESLARELEVAEKIQKQLLITDFEMVSGAELYARNVAHFKIGGDFYDVIPRGDFGFFVCIADVAGKGIGAALLMANLQANLRALILSQNSLVAIIHKLHGLLEAITHGQQFVTLFLAHVKFPEKEIDFVNAGHNPPYLIHEGKLQKLEKGTIPLGILDLPQVEEGTVSFASGDMLFLYTDGLIEQENESGDLLGDERVEDALLKANWKDPVAVVESLTLLCHDHSGGVPQSDDITMLSVVFE